MASTATPTRYEFRDASDFAGGTRDAADIVARTLLEPAVVAVVWAGGDRWIIEQGRWNPSHVWDHTERTWIRPPVDLDDDYRSRTHTDLDTALAAGAELAGTTTS